MKTAVIACKTIEDELKYAIRKTGTEYPVEWLEPSLHNTTKKLRSELQKVLDGIHADQVLMSLGFCGNSIEGIQVRGFELIFSRVDDCISLLLGSVRNRMEVSERYAAYFLTEGWLRGGNNIWVEYRRMADKYGKELAEKLGEAMYGHYRTLALLDCGVNPVGPLAEDTKIIADTLHLEQEVVPATVSYVEELLTGP